MVCEGWGGSHVTHPELRQTPAGHALQVRTVPTVTITHRKTRPKMEGESRSGVKVK